MLDLFSPQVESRRFHSHFLHAMEKPYDRAVLESWANGFVDRDGKFVAEFQTTFNSSFWELYLFACLKEFGLYVEFSYDAPDFVILDGPMPMTIEVTSAHNAIGDPDESALTVEDFMALERAPVVEKATIRLAGALSAKHKKYRERYSTFDHVRGKPFVLAIAPFEQPGFFVQNAQAMTRVLYAYETPIVEFAPGSQNVGHLINIFLPSGSLTVLKSILASLPDLKCGASAPLSLAMLLPGEKSEH